MTVLAFGGRPLWAALSLFFALVPAVPRPAAQPAPEILQRGAYIFAAAGCKGCHTDVKAKGPLLAGGRALKTPFGTFYGPNITPDPVHGIGRWSDADFVRALRHGIAPDGSHYFPVFPYTAFSLMTDADIRALKAYIFSLPAVAKPNRPHEVSAPFSWRFLQLFWKWLYFEPGPLRPDPGRDAQWNRGAYLVRAVAHCGECHTPRTALGGLDMSRWLGGSPDGAEGEPVPNITPDPVSGIGKWSTEQIMFYLELGELPDGDYAGSLMVDVIENSTSKLTAGDRAAIAAYLRTVPPIRGAKQN